MKNINSFVLGSQRQTICTFLGFTIENYLEVLWHIIKSASQICYFVMNKEYLFMVIINAEKNFPNSNRFLFLLNECEWGGVKLKE